MPILDWKTMPNGQAKYQAYLASREWALLKERVKARSGGTCENCQRVPGTQTHHQTYERIYREELADLLHVCEPCHAFLSGKSKKNPASVPFDYAMLHGRRIERVYLAGKITKTKWRDQIAPGWSYENHSDFPNEECQDRYQEWEPVRNVIPVRTNAKLAMTGPFWRNLGYGGGHSTIDYGTAGAHAMSDSSQVKSEHGMITAEIDTRFVLTQVIKAIGQTDLFFAWIDCHECYGTVAEIVLAVTRGCHVVVAKPPEFDHREYWLPFTLGQMIIAPSPLEAWKTLWSNEAPVITLLGLGIIEPDPFEASNDDQRCELEPASSG